MQWLSDNYKWLFDGIGALVLMAVLGYFVRRILRPSRDDQKDTATLNAQGAKVTNSPVASGSNISQTINSPTVNLSLPTPSFGAPRCDFWLQFHPQGSRFLFVQNNGVEPAFDAVVCIPADGSGFKSDVIHRLDSDRTWVACLLKGNFFSMESARKVLVETLLHPSDGGEEVKAIPVLIRYRTHTQRNCEFPLEIRMPLQNGIQFALPEVAEVAEISTSRSQKDRQASAKMLTADEDRSNWPDVILECQWPSLLREPKIPGSHTVRRRPWMLRYRGSDAVYNVYVHQIDFGEYRAVFFPSPVRTLTDTASVHPLICRKSDGLANDAHDLESLIHNPPSGSNVRQYAVETDYAIETDGNEDEEIIGLEGFIPEVEIPVTISYDDKNGNQFKIKYLLHYDAYAEKGEMIRIGRIEKVLPK
jgi:hypothetical protein